MRALSILSILILSTGIGFVEFAWCGAGKASVVRTWGENPSVKVSKELRVLSWNIQKTNGEERWSKALSDLAQQTDLFLGQEGWTNDVFDSTLSQIQSAFWLFARAFEFKGKEAGVFLGSRFHISDYQVHLSPHREPGSMTRKSALSARLPLEDGRDLFVLNIHALNFVATGTYEAQIRPLFEMLDTVQGPVLVAGDFNTWNQFRREFLFAEANRRGLTTVIFPQDPRRLKLDFIFFKGLELKEAKLRHDISTSDHSPLEVVFQLPSSHN